MRPAASHASGQGLAETSDSTLRHLLACPMSAEMAWAQGTPVARAVARAVVTEVGSGTVAVVSQRQAAPLAVELLRS